jgi:hypothetical protein
MSVAIFRSNRNNPISWYCGGHLEPLQPFTWSLFLDGILIATNGYPPQDGYPSPSGWTMGNTQTYEHDDHFCIPSWPDLARPCSCLGGRQGQFQALGLITGTSLEHPRPVLRWNQVP